MRHALLALSLLAPLVGAAQTVERVEPAFWWAGMHHPELQVMLYGEDVGRARATLAETPGVTLDRVVAVENPNYLFLEMTVGPDAEAGPLALTLEGPDGTQTLDYELRERSRRPGSYAQGFSSEDVIYLMMPDRFANGDESNDSIPGMLEGADRSDPNARHGGDFAGVLEHLGYIDDLGMTAIWFTPVFENDMTPAYGAYHGYAATDMYATDPRFGTTDEFVALVDAVHGRGLKVIMDMIHNHVGDRHWWMDDLPTSDWVHDWERVGQTNFTGPAAIDPYASEADRRQLVDGWFVREMPDLNQRNPLLAQYLLQNTVWWIEHTGIDGIRMDTYLYPDKAYMARWARYVLDAYPDFNIVGESWVTNVPHEAYWQDDFAAPGDGYDSDLPSVTDFPLAFALRGAFTGGGPYAIYETLAQDHIYPDPNGMVTFFDNHDLDRAYSDADDLSALALGYAFQMTTRGIPQVYYGTEVAIPNGPRTGGDGYKRLDMPGGWPGDARSVFTEAGRTEREQEAFEVVRALSRWRRTADVIHHGRLTQFIPRDDVYVYFRWDEDPGSEPGAGSTVMVVLNAASEGRTLDLGRLAERLGSVATGRDVVTRTVYDLTRPTLAVPARTALVLEVQ
ncbi:glycoside hydrolase family 13 protein [Rubrivirga marina]|uniref:Glycosyl hydrolase n=1 Tax=Rubrivirga marina TaxID=1196024 RepID=A0A271IWR0_9BACT|nr:glycoside hydrolase family 13 protein [Rubrivirga marina]PAP75622.1 glycosyl hydrolase [Rubrivirga marina]